MGRCENVQHEPELLREDRAKEGYRARYESLNALPKIVFSSTLQEPLGWSNSTVISEDAVDRDGAAQARDRQADALSREHLAQFALCSRRYWWTS